MAKFDYRELTPKERREMLDRLTEIFMTVKKAEELRLLLERLLTQSEIVMIMRRFEVAQMLVRGLTYEQIQRKLGVGLSTLQSVDGWLTDAAYEYHLIREHNQEQARKEKVWAEQEKKLQNRRQSTIPGSLGHLIRHDSRLILFRLLLGDF